MKKFYSIFILFIIFSASLFGQPTENGTLPLTSVGVQIAKVNGSSYTSGRYAIGYDTTGGSYIFRTYFEFDLSSFPAGTQISTVTVSYSNGNHGSYTLKLTQLATISTDAGSNWAAIGNGTSLQTA